METGIGPPAAVADRRSEARRVLTHFGFEEGQSFSAFDGRRVRSSWCLARGLQSSGPILHAFSDYLASRPDLLPAPDRECFSGNGVAHQALPRQTIERILERMGIVGELELTDGTDRLNGRLRNQLLCVIVPARLKTGEAVLAKVQRPAVEQTMAEDLDQISFFSELELVGADDNSIDLGAAADGFLAQLPLMLDLREERRSMQVLAKSELLEVPRVYSALSSRKLTVFAEHYSRRLGREAPRPDEQENGGNVALVVAEDRGKVLNRTQHLCRKAATAFLLAALRDGVVLEDVSLDNLEISPDNDLIFFGGICATIGSSRDLERYLIATADQRPDRTLSSLERLSDATPKADHRKLQTRIRLATAFRDFGLPDSRYLPNLVDVPYLHGRALRSCGFAPSSDLLALLRGLASIDHIQIALAGGDDSLEAALRRYRVLRAARDVRDTANPKSWPQTVQSTVPAVLDLVEKLEERELETSIHSLSARTTPRTGAAWRYPLPTLLVTVSLALVVGRWLVETDGLLFPAILAGGLVLTALAVLIPWSRGGSPS